MNNIVFNEHIKRKYFKYEQEANGKSPKTIKKIRHSLFIFDNFFKKDYKQFNSKVASNYKAYLDKLLNEKTKMPIGLSTKKDHIFNLKNFLMFLSRERGCKKFIQYNDIQYLNLSNAEEAKLRTNNSYIEFPSLKQCIEVLNAMPNNQLLEKRNRAMFATLVLSGARIEALSSLSIGSVNINKNLIKQNAKDGVKTKFSKNIHSFYFPVGKIFETELHQWILFLTNNLKYSQKSNYASNQQPATSN